MVDFENRNGAYILVREPEAQKAAISRPASPEYQQTVAEAANFGLLLAYLNGCSILAHSPLVAFLASAKVPPGSRWTVTKPYHSGAGGRAGTPKCRLALRRGDQCCGATSLVRCSGAGLRSH
jgi:hypothetical protein